jgi:plastocyanin
VRSLRIAVAVSSTVLMLGVAVLSAPGAGAGEQNGGNAKRVRVFDDCDPATFNAAVAPGACVKPGRTVFGDFIAQLQANGDLANEAADGWKFKPATFHVDAGDTIKIDNVGGEFHTFTMVAEPGGGGCVKIINDILGLAPVPECAPLAPDGVTPLAFVTSGIASDGTLSIPTSGLVPGMTYHFQCLIHPWMEATVTVRAPDHHGQG